MPLGPPGKNDLQCMSGRPLILLPVPVITMKVNISKIEVAFRSGPVRSPKPSIIFSPSHSPNLHLDQGTRLARE
jgi:hypothetical protein